MSGVRKIKTSSRFKKVCRLRRKSKGKIYESPQVFLNPHFNDFIERKYCEFQGRGEVMGVEGDVVVLFLPDPVVN